jgi:protein-tyrosine-phosphatase/tRNA A37 threonylcarbamoyladenosine synthetase subunit TsaC/SUA5/YrdC
MKRISLGGGINPKHLQEALKVLRANGVLLVPTEENYLLVSLSEARLRPFGYTTRQCLLPGKKGDNYPFSSEEKGLVVPLFPPHARKLAAAFMPGGLTLIVRTAQGTTGFLMPRGQLLEALPGQFEATRREAPLHFRENLDCDSASELAAAYAEADLWLDAGPMALRPTTLIDVSGDQPALLRKGSTPILDLETVLGRKVRLGPEVLFSVLFVCTGNTCRSPMAKAILEQRAKNMPVFAYSAGTAGIEGMSASEGARNAVKDFGADLSGHRSTGLTRPQIRDADLILTMEPRHRQQVLEMSPDAVSRTFVLPEYAGMVRTPEIYDPVGMSLEVFREVAKIIAACLDQVVRDIMQRTEETTDEHR